MPKLYEEIRDQYAAKGKPLKVAKRIAAATYNKIRKTHPEMAKLSNKHKSRIRPMA